MDDNAKIYAGRDYIIWVILSFLVIWFIQSAFVVCLCAIGEIKGYAITAADGVIVLRILLGLKWRIRKLDCWVYISLAFLLIPLTQILASPFENG